MARPLPSPNKKESNPMTDTERTRDIETHRIVWQGIELEIRFERNWGSGHESASCVRPVRTDEELTRRVARDVPVAA